MAKKKKPVKPAADKPARPKSPKDISSGRSRGRPLEPIIGPKEIEKITAWLAEGKTLRWMGEQLGVTPPAIHAHIQNKIRPALREPWRRSAEMTLNELEHISRTCWERFYTETPAEVVEDIKQALVDGGSKKNARKRLRIVEKSLKKSFKPGQVAWLKLALDVAMKKAQLLGYFAPNVTVVRADTSDDEYRVAGASREQVNIEVIQRLIKLVDETEFEKKALQHNLDSQTVDAVR